LVQRPVYDEVVQRLVRRPGHPGRDPSAPGNHDGAGDSAGQMKTVLNYIEIGKAEGASAGDGGARLGGEGYFIGADGVRERRA